MNLWFQKPSIEYCEKAGNEIIARPFYAVTNFAYFLSSVSILRKSRDFLALSFAFTSALIGLFSFIYDAQPNRLTQLFDLTGMFVFISLLLAVNLSRVFKITLNKAYVLLTSVPIASVVISYYFGGLSGNIIFGLLIVSYITSELFLKPSKAIILQWLKSLGLFFVGFLIWVLDYAKVFCMPGNYLNGRGFFHIITAIVIYRLYNYYASNQKEFGIK